MGQLVSSCATSLTALTFCRLNYSLLSLVEEKVVDFQDGQKKIILNRVLMNIGSFTVFVEVKEIDLGDVIASFFS